MNDELKLLFKISDSLKEQKLIKSVRFFSSTYLGKSQNYLNVLKYLNKKPSISSCSYLQYKLNVQNIFPEFQMELFRLIKNKLASKELR